ncbi:MAG: glycosyl transferase family 2 [Bacteroidia bacterium]|nr:MAG: glycosyl transferase family 2 [Bacteroidia bacterium]
MENPKEYTFSVVVPVYNRPDEIDELLQSLRQQTYKQFEIIIVEDGSKNGCHEVVKKYEKQLNIKYYYKENTGPGTTRNYGAERAHGDYLVFFDSDCIIPEKYFEIVNKALNKNKLDAFGGPDMAHESFTVIQKAISYSMTSFLTTGGIRGSKKSMEKFHPRSFNMGYTQEVFEATEGFSTMRFGEDIDMSIRIVKKGFSTGLIKEAGVFHKRRTDFRKFFKQVHNSGIARINLFKRHPESLKIVHTFPAIFTIGSSLCLILGFFNWLFLAPLLLYAILIFLDSLRQNKHLLVAIFSIAASYIQLFSYGLGFIRAVWKRIIKKDKEFHAFRKNFYK